MLLSLVTRFARLPILLLFLAASGLRAAEVIPPKPPGYFNDYANIVSKEAAFRFNEQLAQFERDTSNQVVVAVFSKMESDSSIEDYAQRTFQSWHVGDQTRNNGVVLFVFIQDRKMWIQTGYGAEGALPDATAFDITERHIKPKFRTQDYEGGLASGIDLIGKALKGEYTGSGKTDLEKRSASSSNSRSFVVPLLFMILFIYLATRGAKRRRGYGYSGTGGPFIGGWGGGGGWSSGSSDGGGFSGFSGGGGSSGGGGAGSSW